MPISIVATPGSASANSFALETEAISRAATRLNLVGWTTVAGSTCTENEKKALIEASRELDLLPWQGTRTTVTQALAIPREAMVDPDSTSTTPVGITGYAEYDDDEIPQRVKDATIELAFEFLKAGTTDLAALDPKIGVIRKTVDVLETEFVHPSERAQGLARFPRVMALIGPLLDASASGGLELVRC